MFYLPLCPPDLRTIFGVVSTWCLLSEHLLKPASFPGQSLSQEVFIVPKCLAQGQSPVVFHAYVKELYIGLYYILHP